jgi:hypothetical protein
MPNPEELRSDLDRAIGLVRDGRQRDPEEKARHWLDKLSEADEERRGFLRLAGIRSASSGGFSSLIREHRRPGPLSPVQERGAADQIDDAGSSLYMSREGEFLAALALEGVAPLLVPIVLAPEQDQPLAAPALQDDPFRSLDLPGTPHVISPSRRPVAASLSHARAARTTSTSLRLTLVML